MTGRSEGSGLDFVLFCERINNFCWNYLDNLGKYCHITLLKIHVFFLSSCRKAKGRMDLLFCQVFKILRDVCEKNMLFFLEKKHEKANK